MDASDIIFNTYAPDDVRRAILEVMIRERISDPNIKVLTPTDTNDDVNGSQHAANGGTDFTYRDVDSDDVAAAETLGVYDYFAETFNGYTGHYYQGSDYKFQAIVINPPTYAISYTI
jgi:hypothetical protein